MRKMTQQDWLETIYLLSKVLRYSRTWHHREQLNSDYLMHPAIAHALDEADPTDWHLLVLEWPHSSDEGNHKIAYTRDDRSGEADRQVVTTIGKYLTRHFPTMPSDAIRDIAARYMPGSAKFVRTTEEMVHAMENGPTSCMSKDRGRFTDSIHPYEAYAPELGWHMALYVDGGNITGRALCNETYYVRSYRGDTGSSYSQTDDRLEAWLREQGYAKKHSWDGYKLKRVSVSNSCGFVAPYVDGNAKYVCEVRDWFEITDDSGDAQWEFDQTDGTADSQSGDPCADCGDMVDEGDGYWVGVYEEERVCECCVNDHYTRVIGRRGNQYYLHDNNTIISVGGEYYDADYLSDNNIVELADGDYVHSDDACFIERLDEYHLMDDCVHCEHSDTYELARDCVQLADGEWAHEDDVWQCEHSNEYYLNDEEGIRYETECGKTVHIDHADEYAPEQTTLPLE